MFCTHVGREVLLASKMVIFCKLGQEPKEGSFPDWHPINSCGVDSTMVSSFLAQRTRGNSLSARTLLSLFHENQRGIYFSISRIFSRASYLLQVLTLKSKKVLFGLIFGCLSFSVKSQGSHLWCQGSCNLFIICWKMSLLKFKCE